MAFYEGEYFHWSQDKPVPMGFNKEVGQFGWDNADAIGTLHERKERVMAKHWPERIAWNGIEVWKENPWGLSKV